MKTNLRLLALAVLLSCTSVESAVLPLVNRGDLWQYRKGTNAPQADWKSASAVLDGTWLTGPGGFGFGTTAQETNSCATGLGDMRGTAATNYTTLYMRKVFTVNQAVDPNLRLLLRMDWDDGYIAWLDGVYLTNNASPGAPGEPAYNAVASNAASGGHESSGGQTPNPAVTNDLGAVGTRLTPGEHVLAIVGLNMSQTSADFVQVADLFADAAAEPPKITNGISGLIAADTVWYATNGIYTVTGNVTVAAGATLTIEPGVTVCSRQGCSITVLGRLLAEGTDAQRILFTRHAADPNWERLLFVRAQDSRFRYCGFEFANCVGDHKNYYATNCSLPFAVGPRNYFEAVVALGCHLDFDYCTFRYLPSSAAGGQGDAVAIISDDLVYRGPASANVRNCQFLNIGQGVNTRYAHVLVENCYFVGKSGDNDDVEVYGEPAYFGLPAPVIRNNVFDMPCAEDRIHPTRCSAVIYGNVIHGSGDHGIVLRDKCAPVVFNNMMHNCPSGGISIQNQSDALIMNNTIVNCGPGIKMFDHTDRWGLPYCLNPGSGRATVINCVIWGNTAGWSLAESTYTNDHGSHLALYYSNIQSNGNSTSASSTLFWGPGNSSADPLFANLGAFNLRLNAGSPCIDAGTNSGTFVITNLLGPVTHAIEQYLTGDLDGRARPLDGDGDNLARMDKGAYEFLLPNADSNSDGIPDGWCVAYGFSPLDGTIAHGDPDRDQFVTRAEYVADTDPTNAASYLRIESAAAGPPPAVSFLSSSNRLYSVWGAPAIGGPWTVLPGRENQRGSGGLMTVPDPAAVPQQYYRIEVTLP